MYQFVNRDNQGAIVSIDRNDQKTKIGLIVYMYRLIEYVQIPHCKHCKNAVKGNKFFLNIKDCLFLKYQKKKKVKKK